MSMMTGTIADVLTAYGNCQSVERSWLAYMASSITFRQDLQAADPLWHEQRSACYTSPFN